MKNLYIILCLLLFGITNAQINETQKLVPTDRAINDRFGYAIAIEGDFALIATPANDLDASNGNFIEDAGAVYAFKKDPNGNWIETQKIVASDRLGTAQFGWSISISGNYAVIGSIGNYFDENGANQLANSGAAYILQRDSNGIWTETQKIVASDRSSSALFGTTVSMDNNQLIIGANGDQFDLNGSNQLNGAGAAYLFERDSNGNWNETQKIIASSRGEFEEFGTSVAMSSNTVIIGSPGDKDVNGAVSGSAYLFNKNTNGDWFETARVVSNDLNVGDLFGYHVSIENNTALIGSIRHEFDASGNNQLFNAGAAYIFTKDSGGNWSQEQKLVPLIRDSETYFGISLQMSGNNAVIGASSYIINISPAESAYVFVKNGNNIWVETDRLQASDQETFDFFGSSVAINNGNIMVGAQIESEDENGANTIGAAGSAYVFESSNLGISDLNLQDKIKFFPNPSSGVITINLDNSYSEINTTTTNILGQIIASEKFTNTNNLQLKIEGSTGIYFVNVTTSEGLSETIKVIKN